MIEGAHIRAARALLGWSREDLLKATGLSMSALMRLEGGSADSRGSTINKVLQALNDAGIEFVSSPDGAVGVMLTRRPADVQDEPKNRRRS